MSDQPEGWRIKGGTGVLGEGCKICMQYCIAKNAKFGFIHLIQSEINCMKICVLCKPCLIAWRVSWEVWSQPGLLYMLCWLFVSFPPSHIFTCLICEENYIYRILRNNWSIHSVTVTRICDTAGSHLIIIIIINCNIISLSPYHEIEYFDPENNNNHLWVNKHHTRTSTRLTYFRLSIGFLKAFCHNRFYLGFLETISPAGVEERETSSTHPQLYPVHWHKPQSNLRRVKNPF